MNKKIKQRINHIPIDGVEYKLCSKCNQLRTLDRFHIDRTRWDGLNHVCKKCRTLTSSDES